MIHSFMHSSIFIKKTMISSDLGQQGAFFLNTLLPPSAFSRLPLWERSRFFFVSSFYARNFNQEYPLPIISTFKRRSASTLPSLSMRNLSISPSYLIFSRNLSTKKTRRGKLYKWETDVSAAAKKSCFSDEFRDGKEAAKRGNFAAFEGEGWPVEEDGRSNRLNKRFGWFEPSDEGFKGGKNQRVKAHTDSLESSLDSQDGNAFIPSKNSEVNAEEKVNSVKSSKIHNFLKQALWRLNISKLAEVQVATFEPIMNGKNVMVRAPTGSGKTFAFLLPVFQKIIENSWSTSTIPILILTPTRELAEQIFVLAFRIRGSAKIDITLIYGGEGEEIQRQALMQGTHVVIGTPGALMQMVRKGYVGFQNLKMLVIDEVDELVSSSFEDNLRDILAVCNSKRQTLLFSATFPRWLDEKLLLPLSVGDETAKFLLFDLVKKYGEVSTNKALSHFICKVPRNFSKRADAASYLCQLHCPPTSKTILFCNTKLEADALYQHPWLHSRSLVLHSDIGSSSRKKRIPLFSKLRRYNVLISSDLAARGLDIPEVRLILHFSPPHTIESYIHRSGRAGRGRLLEVSQDEAMSSSIVLYDSSQFNTIRHLQQELSQPFEKMHLPSEDDIRRVFLDKIEEELGMPLGYDVSGSSLEKDAILQYEIHGPRLLAAALYLLEKRKRIQPVFSVLSGRSNYLSLLFNDPTFQRISSRIQLVSLLKKCGVFNEENSSPSSIGRIVMTSRGYAVDLPEAIARKMMQSEELKKRLIHVSYLSKMPSIIIDEGAYRSKKLSSPVRIIKSLYRKLRQSSVSQSTRRRWGRKISLHKTRLAVASLKHRR